MATDDAVTQPFTDAIAEAEKLVASAPHIESEADLLEGLEYLAGSIAASLHLVYNFSTEHPVLLSGTGPFTKMGLDNPDFLYFATQIDGHHDYVLSGTRGSTVDLNFQLLDSAYTDRDVPESVTAFDDRNLAIHEDGSYRVSIGAAPVTGCDTHIPIAPRPAQLIVREAYNDWTENRGTVAISRADTLGTGATPLTKEFVLGRYIGAGHHLINRVKTWLQFPQWFYMNNPPNVFEPPRITPGGLSSQFSSVGYFELEPGQALIVTVPKSDAPYQGFQLGSMWYVSLDYINHQTSLNSHQSHVDPDGKIRLVISDRNPGLDNWIETVGHRRGFLKFRWQRTNRPILDQDGPRAEVVDFDRIKVSLPFHADHIVTAEQWRSRIAARQTAVATRMLG
ncbi:Uncharacterised protein [Mycobacteroides abscessus subsp. massiliense]|nr:Uncharacterised protein [Mycobacteroides abscessus subsp. massiliense]SKM01465.1 Uncharacterised protein [Mycobacteroides abscessus subsp. massiliense]SLD22550.1 Uncharacterised protein [Mycobacteroides abscessus subsp. massiliense]SLD49536.1 Uncharacterised protein [Mycobacteroides abscessus subsp. massiliense]